jgi:hypothetical protein
VLPAPAVPPTVPVFAPPAEPAVPTDSAALPAPRFKEEIKNIGGVRAQDAFKVRVYSKAEFAAKVGKNERYLVQ